MLDNELQISFIRASDSQIFISINSFLEQIFNPKEPKMKVLIIFAVVLSVVHMNLALSEEEMKKIFMETAMACKASEGASDDDFASLAAKKPPTTHEGKCLMACIVEKEGVVSCSSVHQYKMLISI